MIKNQYEQLIGPFPNGLVEGAEPFFFPGGPIGCLLVHGFTSHPLEMRDMGEFLAARSLTVLGVRLPGHGTTPADLAGRTWMEWDEEVYRGYQALSRACSVVTAAGSSTGGTLLLHLSLHAPLAAVAALAPPVYRVANPLARWASWLQWVVAYRKKGGPSVADPSIDTRPYGYDVNPAAAVAQLIRLMDHVRGEVPALRCPLWVCHGRQDAVVPMGNSERLVAQAGSAVKSLQVMEHSGHMLTVDRERTAVFESALEFVRAPSAAGHDPS